MSERKYPDSWPAPEDYLLEIGRLTVLFSCLESAINLAISKLAGYPQVLDWRSAVVTAHMNFKQRVDIIETMCHELHDELGFEHLKDYSKVIKKIRKAQGLRNKFTHNAIVYNKDSGKVETSFLSARGKLKPVIEEVKLSDIKEAIEVTHVAQLNLHELITKAKYQPRYGKDSANN